MELPMIDKTVESPTILVPYVPADADCSCQDVFFYLRPETNGVLVESRIMRVIQQDQRYRDSIELAYLANLPGSFILEKKIVHRHYHVKIHFARMGINAFTGYMRSAFREFTGVDPENAEILGAFDACDALDLSAEELFHTWVPVEDMLTVCGQSVKKIRGVWVVNYDIPAILSSNNVNTDIAVMIFRTSLGYTDIHQMVESIGNELHRSGLLKKEVPLARAFHYSKGPFEQILDAQGYLIRENGKAWEIEHSRFSRYLMEVEGFSLNEVKGILDHSIFGFHHTTRDGSEYREEDIFLYTQGDTYPDAAEKLSRAATQYRLYGYHSAINAKNISKMK